MRLFRHCLEPTSCEELESSDIPARRRPPSAQAVLRMAKSRWHQSHSRRPDLLAAPGMAASPLCNLLPAIGDGLLAVISMIHLVLRRRCLSLRGVRSLTTVCPLLLLCLSCSLLATRVTRSREAFWSCARRVAPLLAASTARSVHLRRRSFASPSNDCRVSVFVLLISTICCSLPL